jgi:WD40 repeat protein
VRRLGQSGFVTGTVARVVRFSPSGRRLAAMADRVIVWNADSGDVVLNYSRGETRPTGIAFVDDETLAVGYPSVPLQLIQIASGKVVREVDVGAKARPSLLGSNDGRTLFVADESASLWNTATWTKLHEFPAGRDAQGIPLIPRVEFSADGKRLLTLTRAGELALLNTSNAQPEGMAAMPNVAGSSSASLSPDGQRLVISGGQTQLLDARTGQLIRTLGEDLAGNAQVSFSPDGTRLAALRAARLAVLDRDGTQTVFQTADARSFAWSPDGNQLAVARQTMIEILDAETGKPVHDRAGHAAAVTRITASPNGDEISSFSLLTVIRWAGAPMTPHPMTLTLPSIDTLRYSRDGQWLDVITASNIDRYHPKTLTLEERKALSLGNGYQRPIISEDRSIIVAFAAGRTAAVIARASDNAILTTITSPTGAGLTDLAPSADGKMLAALWNDKLLEFRSTGGGSLIQKVTDLPDQARVVRWAPGSDSAAVIGQNALMMYNTDSGRKILQIRGADPRDVVFSPDGLFAAATFGANIAIFDATTGENLGSLAAGNVEVTSIAFHADGLRLLGGMNDGSILIYDLRPFLIRSGTNLAARTPEELYRSFRISSGRLGLAAVAELSRRDAAAVVPLVREHLREFAHASPWKDAVAQLGSEDRAVREKAHRDLEAAGRNAAPEIHAALKAGPTGEVKERLEALARLIHTEPLPAEAQQDQAVVESTESRAKRRTIQLLEWTGGPQAAALLEEMGADPRFPRAAAAAERLKLRLTPTTQP